MESKRFIIRRLNKEDWQYLYNYLSLEEVVKYEPYPIFTKGRLKVKQLVEKRILPFGLFV